MKALSGSALPWPCCQETLPENEDAAERSRARNKIPWSIEPFHLGVLKTRLLHSESIILSFPFLFIFFVNQIKPS